MRQLICYVQLHNLLIVKKPTTIQVLPPYALDLIISKNKNKQKNKNKLIKIKKLSHNKKRNKNKFKILKHKKKRKKKKLKKKKSFQELNQKLKNMLNRYSIIKSHLLK
jgi:hypothetical protein